MWKRLNLRQRLYLLLAAIFLLNLAGGLITIWYSYRMEGLLHTITEKNLTAFRVAGTLETALINQKGFVSYYFLDGDPEWLRQLGEYRQIFREQLQKARRLAENERQLEMLNRIETEYNQYIAGKDRVISFYKADKREEGAALHQTVRKNFFTILALCESYRDTHAEQIVTASARSLREAARMRMLTAAAVSVGFFLIGLMAFLFVRQILLPVRRLTKEADREPVETRPDDEIKALSRTVRVLIKDMDHTYSELEKSREHLLQTEKLAMVGKLAAGMAHSIRNPFTSVKMRLFSLNRSLKMTPTQEEDFNVISDEIRRIDTIVQNFLEFSRPPKLEMQQISPSVVVDQTIQLLSHRLKSYEVETNVHRIRPLPTVTVDPEQLKEVLVNLIVNACEAIQHGGVVDIAESVETSDSKEYVAVIRVTDSGPGITAQVREKIFQPFFTTKEEGTGLGLSIAERIVHEHKGDIHVSSREGFGTTFTITLPIGGADIEHHLGN